MIVDAPDASFTWDINSGCTPATVTFSKDMTGIANSGGTLMMVHRLTQ